MLRAVLARWFEVLVPRIMVARAVEVLAATGKVELDPAGDRGAPLAFEKLREELEGFRRMRRNYASHWPEPVTRTDGRDRMLERILARALKTLAQWEEQAAPLIREAETLNRDQAELDALADLLEHLAGEPIDFGRLTRTRSELSSAVFVLAAESETPKEARAILYRRVDTPGHTYLLTLGRPDAIGKLEDALGGRRARLLRLPQWLEGDPERALEIVGDRRSRLQSRLEEGARQLDALNQALDMARTLGDLVRVEWMAEHLEGINVGGYFAQITGWTSDREGGDSLRRALADAGIPAVLHMPGDPADRIPPTINRNPFWARPFEIFGSLLGTPGRDEAEPSILVALIAPLLFGYMFGDVGQGLVIMSAGFILRRRWPMFGMLISGGLVSVFFGLMFGSVFAMEGLIPPLWVNPMAAPIPVMVAPLFGGGTLILLSMLLNAVTHQWQGKFPEWLADEAGLAVFYLSALVAVIQPWALVPAALGLAWQVAGGAWVRRRHRGAALAHGLATLPERLMQLAVNTLSFVRVGAFALAHAGLGQAAASLSDAAQSTLVAGLVLVLGNALILLIEGIVVSVQTTRLVLFEFFIRFFRTAGRPFTPLSLPAVSSST